MRITSQAFVEGGRIPKQYTKYGENRIPPIHLEDIPARAKSLALIVEDPDAPNGTFNHWLLYNLDPKTTDIKENRVPEKAAQGQNDFGEVDYGGPKPPSGEHRYFFRAFALDTKVQLPEGIQRRELEQEMKDHVVDEAVLMGKYGGVGDIPVQGQRE